MSEATYNAPPLGGAYLENFETLKRAAENEDLALVSAIRKSDGQPVALVCAVGFDRSSEEFNITPFAVMVEGDPFELFEPPEATLAQGGES
jgi:hypothetical protein